MKTGRVGGLHRSVFLYTAELPALKHRPSDELRAAIASVDPSILPRKFPLGNIADDAFCLLNIAS